MIIPDVNLLLYATIDGFPQHEAARAWWESALNGQESVGLTGPAVFGFLRVATNPRVLELPMAISDATGHVRRWLTCVPVEFVGPGDRHLDLAFAMLEEIGTAGNLTTDVQLAAYAMERKAVVHSNDSDFGRFPNLSWVNPLSTDRIAAPNADTEGDAPAKPASE